MPDKIKEIICRIHPETNEHEITEGTRFLEDLNFDSLAMFSLLVELEEAFDFKFSCAVNFETVSDVCGYLECRI